jgi:excisionase family DNA binding protein
MIEKQLLTEKQAAELLKVSVMTLKRLRYAGTGPDFITIGRSIRYDPEDIDKYLTSNKQTQEG